MKTCAAPLWRSTSHISLPTTEPARSRPCASIARPWTPWNDDGGTTTSGVCQALGRTAPRDAQAVVRAHRAPTIHLACIVNLQATALEATLAELSGRRPA